MRKRLIAAALALAITFTLGCEEKESGKTAAAEAAAPKPAETASCKGVKLLESITNADGKVQKKFEYDNQNRLVKILHYDDTTKINYGADGSVAVNDGRGYVKKYVGEGNKIGDLTIDKNGYIVKDDNTDYQYENGNLIGKELFVAGSTSYTYDNKRSPFSNTNTPKWLVQSLFLLNMEYASKNSVLKVDIHGEEDSFHYEYKYEYDSDGFPTKQESESCGKDCIECDEVCSTSTIHYTYLCN